MCGWNKAIANRRQAESRVKLAWLCEARRRKTKSTGVMPGDMSFSQWPGREENDEVNRRITSGRIRNHNMRDTAKYGKMV